MSVHDIQFVHKFWNMLNRIDQAASSAQHINLNDLQTRLEFQEYLQSVTSEVLAINQSASIEDICETLLSYLHQIKHEELNDVRMSFFANFLLLLGDNEYCWEFFEMLSEATNKYTCEKYFIDQAYQYSLIFKEPLIFINYDNDYKEKSRLLFGLLSAKGPDRFIDIFRNYNYIQKHQKAYFFIICDMARIALKEFDIDRATKILSDDSDDYNLENSGISQN